MSGLWRATSDPLVGSSGRKSALFVLLGEGLARWIAVLGLKQDSPLMHLHPCARQMSGNVVAADDAYVAGFHQVRHRQLHQPR